MVEMDAFERQVADVARRVVGPARPIDALAIARSATARRPRPWWRSWLGALKLVTAGAVVALFGGLVWVGSMPAERDGTSLPGAVASTAPTRSPAAEPTTRPSFPPERSTRDDLVAGVSLVTEEVEPGVFRVVGDGVRDLAWVPATDGPYCCYYDHAVAVAPDGRPWFFRPEGFFALAGPTQPWGVARGRVEFHSRAPYVIRDGRLWTTRDGRLVTTMVDEDSERPDVNGATPWTDVRRADEIWVDASGTIWASSGSRKEGDTLAQSDDEGATWTKRDMPKPPRGVLGDSFADPEDGTVWLIGSHGRVFRHDGGDWRQVGVVPGERTEAEMGPDGTIWIWGPWARIADGEVTVFDVSEAVPVLSGPHDGGGQFEVASDGSLWFTARDQAASVGDCDGIAHFDGVRVQRFLRGLCPWAFAFAEDGAVWVLAGANNWVGKHPKVETFLIRPEAAMADR
jgi:hypothetical protein